MSEVVHYSPEERLNLLTSLSTLVRKRAFETIANANSGHLGGSSSSVELLTTLYFGGDFNFDPHNDKNPDRDRVLIRGHEGPVRYPIFSLIGYLDKEELKSYRQLGSMLQGHEDMDYTPGVDITPSGSLGMLLSYGTGAAVELKRQGRNSRTIVFLGDGEEQEGNVSEAARHAATLGLDNLICIIDNNKKQLSRPTHDVDHTDKRMLWTGYGWDVLEIQDGHDIEEIMRTYKQLQYITKPTMVIANTIKGKGLPGAEGHFSGYHTISTITEGALLEGIEATTKTLEIDEEVLECIAPALMSVPGRTDDENQASNFPVLEIEPSPKDVTNLDSAQGYYLKSLFTTLESCGSHAPFYVITPDFIRSDIVDYVRFKEFSQYFDVGLREQHAISLAHGIAVTNKDSRIFVNFGDAFIYRASDQLNASVQGNSHMLILGEFAGLSQDHNGRTHESSGQPGALIYMPGLMYYEPADVADMYNVFNLALTANSKVNYARIHRKNIKPLYREEKDRDNTTCYITHDPGRKPDLVIVSSGMTTQASVAAAEKLETEHSIPTRVINVVGYNNLNELIAKQVENDVPILTTYNGNPRVLQSVVATAVMEAGKHPKTVKGHGFEMGTSGKLVDLERHFKLDELGIVATALSYLSRNSL